MAPEMIFLVKRNNCGLQTWREVVTEVLRTLHDDGPHGDTVAVADVADLQPDEIPSAQLAVDTKENDHRYRGSAVYQWIFASESVQCLLIQHTHASNVGL
jgi:hypothetical protein